MLSLHVQTCDTSFFTGLSVVSKQRRQRSTPPPQLRSKSLSPASPSLQIPPSTPSPARVGQIANATMSPPSVPNCLGPSAATLPRAIISSLGGDSARTDHSPPEVGSGIGARLSRVLRERSDWTVGDLQCRCIRTHRIF